MIAPPATTPREGPPDSVRWCFRLMRARLRRCGPWWPPPPPRLVAPNGNIAGSEGQYRVASKPPRTHRSRHVAFKAEGPIPPLSLRPAQLEPDQDLPTVVESALDACYVAMDYVNLLEMRKQVRGVGAAGPVTAERRTAINALRRTRF